MSTPWETEEEADAQITLQRDVAASLTARQLGTLGRQRIGAEYKTKAYLALVDSDKHDWGIVEDTLNNLLWRPGEGEIVGTWSRPKYDNLVHISLCTAISALQDRSTQTFAKYAEERRQREEGLKKPTRARKKAAQPVQEPLPDLSVDEKLEFNELRARLGRTK